MVTKTRSVNKVHRNISHGMKYRQIRPDNEHRRQTSDDQQMPIQPFVRFYALFIMHFLITIF
jgi:hypothetical protein